MRANVTRRTVTITRKEWVIESDGFVEVKDLDVVRSWARTALPEKLRDYDDSIKFRGQEDGSIVVWIETESVVNGAVGDVLA